MEFIEEFSRTLNIQESLPQAPGLTQVLQSLLLHHSSPPFLLHLDFRWILEMISSRK